MFTFQYIKRKQTNGQTGSETMSILKAVMVDFRAWNNCLVALNMYIKWVRDRDRLCGDIAVQCFILIAELELLKEAIE